MIKFRLIEKGNPGKPTEPKKWHALAIYSDKVTQKELSANLADLSSLSMGDVANVITNLVQELPKILSRGGIVQLGELGSFRITLSSTWAATKQKFSTETIKPKITFTPWIELKKALDTLKYQQE